MPYRVAKDEQRMHDVGRPEELGYERIDGPLESLFDPAEDGWDRPSIKLNTHPLHPFPDLGPADLLLPSNANKLRFVLDCLAVGLAMALLSYFPLLLISWTQTRDLSSWIYGTMTTVGAGSALLLFVVAITEERRFRAEL
ncbi:MAG TPA: hypothetical protein VE615_03300 [Gaiellaceae bacterium]|jgi:hypothetical protein|nr:hypothetical protein [Gaiellaceae bacterium]